jgi:hypothetical protein
LLKRLLSDGFLAETSPGSKHLSIAESGITDYYLTEKDLTDLYSKWNIIVLEKLQKRDFFYGKEYARELWWALIENSSKQKTN